MTLPSPKAWYYYICTSANNGGSGFPRARDQIYSSYNQAHKCVPQSNIWNACFSQRKTSHSARYMLGKHRKKYGTTQVSYKGRVDRSLMWWNLLALRTPLATHGQWTLMKVHSHAQAFSLPTSLASICLPYFITTHNGAGMIFQQYTPTLLTWLLIMKPLLKSNTSWHPKSTMRQEWFTM